jgi:hypothetical protein
MEINESYFRDTLSFDKEKTKRSLLMYDIAKKYQPAIKMNWY